MPIFNEDRLRSYYDRVANRPDSEETQESIRFLEARLEEDRRLRQERLDDEIEQIFGVR